MPEVSLGCKSIDSEGYALPSGTKRRALLKRVERFLSKYPAVVYQQGAENHVDESYANCKNLSYPDHIR